MIKTLLKPVIDRLNPAKAASRIERDPHRQQALDRITKGLTLYHYTTCPFCIRVRRVIDELGFSIEMKDINRDPEARTELMAGGGKPTVPCLLIDGLLIDSLLIDGLLIDGSPIDGPRMDTASQYTWLYESADIIRYLKKLSATV